MTEGRYSDFTLFRLLLRQARPYLPYVVGVFLLGLLWAPLALLTPLPLKIAVDSILGSRPLPGFLGALVPDAVASSTTVMIFFVAGLVVAIALLTELVQLATYVTVLMPAAAMAAKSFFACSGLGKSPCFSDWAKVP